MHIWLLMSVIYVHFNLQDFLRQLPGGLLMEEKCKSWMTAMEKEGEDQKRAEIKM